MFVTAAEYITSDLDASRYICHIVTTTNTRDHDLINYTTYNDIARLPRPYFIVYIRDPTIPSLLYHHQHPCQLSCFVHGAADIGHLSPILKSSELERSNCPALTYWHFHCISGPVELISHNKLDTSNKRMDTQMGYDFGGTDGRGRVVHGA